MAHEARAALAETIVGISAWADDIRAEILQVADRPSNVLITGPTGTGKELIAQSIHRCSLRAAKPFIPVDCAAVSGALFASHLFGHVEGAFTGANHDALGCFRAANGGTVFLDEIGELQLEFQANLLRVLQCRTVTPLGSHQEIPVDFRVIAATNRNLAQMMAAGRFREDLYYRLNVISLHATPLKDRPEDIEVLARDFLRRLAARSSDPIRQFTVQCFHCLRSHAWPGNVRELENYLERVAFSFVMDELSPPGPSGHPSLAVYAAEVAAERSLNADRTTHDCESCLGTLSSEKDSGPASRWLTLDELEREHIQRTLEHVHHNQSLAAGLLGIPRQRLARKVMKHGLDTSRSRRGRPSK